VTPQDHLLYFYQAMEQTFFQKVIITAFLGFFAAYLLWCFNHALDGSKFTVTFSRDTNAPEVEF